MYDIVEGGAIITPGEFRYDLFYRFFDMLDVGKVTRKSYYSHLRNFFRWLYDNRITDPEEKDVLAYKEYLENEGFRAGTRAQYLRVVKIFFKWAEKKGLYENIAEDVKVPTTDTTKTRKEAFSAEDIRGILESIDTGSEAGKRDYAMVLLSVVGGLRIIELQRADVGDVKTIRGQRVLYIQGKGHEEKDDYMKLPEEVDTALMEYLESRGAYKRNDPLFTGAGNRSRGKRLTEPTISHIIRDIYKKAGFECDTLTAHSLRHTSHTLLFKAGADLYTVQRHARHKDPKTTEIYLHMNDRDEDRSEEIIYNSIFRPEEKDTFTKCVDILRTLTEEERERALAELKKLGADPVRKGA